MPEDQKEVLDGNGSLIIYHARAAEVRHEAPLVLFFAWLDAPESALQKYIKLYHGHGMDVLVIKSQIKFFLWPNCGMKQVQEIMDVLVKSRAASGNLIVHAMSIGAFVYTVMLITCSLNQEKYGGFIERIQCQILDSVVIGGLPKMIQGIAKSVTSQKCLEMMVKMTSSLFFNLTKSYTVDFYNRALDYFYDMPVKGPTLFLYSLTDPMCNSEASRHLVDLWRSQGRHIVEKCWENSRHAAHILQSDYAVVHSDFLRRIQLISKL